MADLPNEWLFRWMNPDLPKYVRERQEQAARDSAARVNEVTRKPILDGSGYPIPEGSGSAWPRIIEAMKKTFGGFAGRGHIMNSQPQPPPDFLGPPVPEAPPAPTPGVTQAAPQPAPAGPPSVGQVPSSPRPATPPTVRGRIAGAMVGPPEPAMGPPEPPASSGSVLDGMDPAVIEQIMQLGDMDRQMAEQEALRDMEMPEGMSFRNSVGGQTYVGGNPLAHGLTAFTKFRAKRRADQIGQDQIEGRKRILDVLRNQ